MEPEPSEDAGEEPESLVEKIVERMRGTGVGTEDPNIIGDAGPTDVPPGRDPDSVWPPPEILEEGAVPVEDPEAPA
ncbi:MAG TPA: hypothetical protein VGR20_01460 [Acidimicrobiia bacterium]|jgi:hypothetical protein|nr:hypothetical protein [Acidimicrobiia bacterium]